MNLRILLLPLAAILFLTVGNANAQFDIDWFTIDGGGGFSSGSGFELEGTIGQHDAGPVMTGGGFSLAGGFWVNDSAGAVALNDVNVFRGVPIEGGLAEVQQSDDVYMRLNPGFTINSTEAPVWVEFFGTAIGSTDIHVESQAGTPGLTYTVEAWNWISSGYEELANEAAQFNSDRTDSFAMVADYVDPGGAVRARIGWRQTGFTINFPWEVRIDQVIWQ